LAFKLQVGNHLPQICDGTVPVRLWGPKGIGDRSRETERNRKMKVPVSNAWKEAGALVVENQQMVPVIACFLLL
jgi:hypothetical protein